MSKVLPFRKRGPDLAAVREQAAVWIARLDGGASKADVEEIQAWLAQDRVHLDVFLEFAELFDQLSALEELSKVYPLNEYDPVPSRDASVPRRAIMAAAASVFMVVALGSWWAGFLGGDASPARVKAHYETAVGEQLTVTLSDGSRMLLNTATTIDVDFSDGTRKIYLDSGEGLFQVAKDATRPFQVFSGKQMVEAVGTAFTVHRTDPNDFEVMVTEGKVMLYRQSLSDGLTTSSLESQLATDENDIKLLPLIAGQYAAVSELNDNVFQIDMPTDKIEARLSWQHGMLLFLDDPLEQVLQQVSRYTNVKITASEEVKDIRVGGYFRVDDIDGLLSAIENNFQINIQHVDENNIYLAPQ